MSIFYLARKFAKKDRSTLVYASLPSERAALCESGFATGGLAEDGRAAGANDDGLGVREDGGDCEAAGTLDVHEKGSRSWH